MATPIKETPQGRNARLGPACRVAVGGALRGKPRRSTGEESRKIPNYLRPSTGSCHDRCKHGIKDEQPEIRRPTRLGSRKRSVVKNKMRVTRTVVPVERNKMTKTRPKHPPDPKIRAPAEPVEVIKVKNSLPSKKVGVSKHSSSTNRKVTQKELKIRPTNVPNPSSTTPNASAGLKGQKNKKDTKATQTGLLPPKPSVSRAVSLKGSKHRNLKLVDQNRMTTTKLKQLIAEKVQEMAKHETKDLEFISTTIEIIRSPPPLTTESTNVENSESSPSSCDKEVLEEESSIIVPVSVCSQSPSDQQVSKSESELADAEEVLEEAEEEEEECEYINDEEGIILEEEEGIILEEEEEEDDDDDDNKIRRSYRVVIRGDKDDEARNIKFGRGKVLELQDEDNGPWRLKFRRGRVLEDNADGQSLARITFKKRLVDEASDDSKHESENVRLRHQEVQQKKEAQELLNNVIEETASKLVEDMKTKVGALVGAFETVIHLQVETPASCE